MTTHEFPDAENSSPGIWKLSPLGLAVVVGVTSLLVAMYWPALEELLHLWETKEEYSHAYLLPFLSAFLVWQRKNELNQVTWHGSCLGAAICVGAILFFFLGTLTTIYAVVHYSLVFLLAGLVLSYLGNSNFRYVWAAIVLLFFTIPFPQFLYQALSTKLQLLSSELGVMVIRALGVSVYLEGNVIDLGTYKLQVVEACNGLRYLFPLASFGFLCAYLYRGPVWHKVILFLSTMPITVLMNSFRIGVIGYTVDRWGQEMAEGFLHDFEGWVIFMACLAVLFAEIALLSRLQRPPQRLTETFYVEIPTATKRNPGRLSRQIPTPFIVSCLCVLLAFLASVGIHQREEIIPHRKEFAEFPLEIEKWTGTTEAIEQVYVNELKFTDYLMINYSRPGSDPRINLYVAYYDSQRAGESVHSPRACIPGGGWKIERSGTETLNQVPLPGGTQEVNRVLIALGEHKQLVYYWFQQRGRIITNEYLVKWYLLWDALTRNRSDGALVRVTTYIPPGEDSALADERLTGFLRELGPTLKDYLPE